MLYREWNILPNCQKKNFVDISVGISEKYAALLIPELLKGQLRLC